ncbi:beat protein-like protein, partial [Dinothrombium tinctorium]
SFCIKLIDIAVPKTVKVGSDVKLICDYLLEGDTLYSLKWHFNNNEFYRFVPRDNPQKQIFPLRYIDV